jgi:hypothetical protein
MLVKHSCSKQQSTLKTNPTNQDRKVVCQKVNRLSKMKIATEKHSDQIPQTAPFNGSDGNTSPQIFVMIRPVAFKQKFIPDKFRDAYPGSCQKNR